MTPFTVGVEEEYQLIDPVTGSLRSHASTVRAGDWTGDISPELQETTVEIETPICQTVDEVRAELARLRFQTATVSEASDVRLVAAGMHPFSRWEGHFRPPEQRYRAIEARYGRIARDEHIFGMHIHVGMPPECDRIAVLNVARHFLPHLLALSASSPFYEGSDTGFDSYRTMMWRRWPNSGIPPYFQDAAEHERYIVALLDSGMIADRKNVYWSLRAHPHYPTLEYRVTDCCPRLEDAVAIAALARGVTVAVANGRIRASEIAGLGTSVGHELLRGNEWRAARDGLEAVTVDALTGNAYLPMKDAIRRLLDRIAPAAEELGDGPALAHIERLLEEGNAASRMRAIHGSTGHLGDVVAWLADTTLDGTGLDRSLHEEMV